MLRPSEQVQVNEPYIVRDEALKLGASPHAEAKETHRYQQYRRLISRAIEVFGDEVVASRWLSMPNKDLGGRVPLNVALSDDFAPESFEPIFVRIEHGIDF